MMVNWSLCVEAYEPAIRVWTWWFRDGFRYFFDFWKFLEARIRHAPTFSMLPKCAHLPLITIQKCKPPRIHTAEAKPLQLSRVLSPWNTLPDLSSIEALNLPKNCTGRFGSIIRRWSSSNRIPNRSVKRRSDAATSPPNGRRWAQPVPQSHWAWWTGALLSQQDHRPGGFNRLISTPSERRCGIIIPGFFTSVSENNPPNITKFYIDSYSLII